MIYRYIMLLVATNVFLVNAHAEVIDCYDAYDALLKVEQEISKGWLSNLMEKERGHTLVDISLDQEGSLVKVELVSSSGNVEFDERVLQAAQEASPYHFVKDLDKKLRTECMNEFRLSFENPNG